MKALEILVNRRRKRWVGAVPICCFMALTWLAYMGRSTPFERPAVSDVYWVSTGAAEVKYFHLPDGTEVTLKANSTLEIPYSYGRSERRVRLAGDAHFEVSPDTLKPFRVSTR